VSRAPVADDENDETESEEELDLEGSDDSDDESSSSDSSSKHSIDHQDDIDMGGAFLIDTQNRVSEFSNKPLLQ
jgi:hypothetical protein